jgi:hypothetical protein
VRWICKKRLPPMLGKKRLLPLLLPLAWRELGPPVFLFVKDLCFPDAWRAAWHAPRVVTVRQRAYMHNNV